MRKHGMLHKPARPPQASCLAQLTAPDALGLASALAPELNVERLPLKEVVPEASRKAASRTPPLPSLMASERICLRRVCRASTSSRLAGSRAVRAHWAHRAVTVRLPGKLLLDCLVEALTALLAD